MSPVRLDSQMSHQRQIIGTKAGYAAHRCIWSIANAPYRCYKVRFINERVGEPWFTISGCDCCEISLSAARRYGGYIRQSRDDWGEVITKWHVTFDYKIDYGNSLPEFLKILETIRKRVTDVRKTVRRYGCCEIWLPRGDRHNRYLLSSLIRNLLENLPFS